MTHLTAFGAGSTVTCMIPFIVPYIILICRRVEGLPRPTARFTVSPAAIPDGEGSVKGLTRHQRAPVFSTVPPVSMTLKAIVVNA